MPDVSSLVDASIRRANSVAEVVSAVYEPKTGPRVGTQLRVTKNAEAAVRVYLKFGGADETIIGHGENTRAAIITAKANLKWALDTLTELEP